MLHSRFGGLSSPAHCSELRSECPCVSWASDECGLVVSQPSAHSATPSRIWSRRRPILRRLLAQQRHAQPLSTTGR